MSGTVGDRWCRHSERVCTTARASGEISRVAEKEAGKRFRYSSFRQRPHYAGKLFTYVFMSYVRQSVSFILLQNHFWWLLQLNSEEAHLCLHPLFVLYCLNYAITGGSEKVRSTFLVLWCYCDTQIWKKTALVRCLGMIVEKPVRA